MYPTSTTRMRSQATCCSRFMPFSLRGQSAGELEQPPHARMAKVRAGAEHHWAAAGDHADVVPPAILDGLRRHARALSQRLMHPDTTDLRLRAVLHDPIGDLRSRDDHDAIHPAGDGFEVGITAIALEGPHVRIHCEDVVPGLLQPLIDQIADRVMALVTRYARHRDALLREKVFTLVSNASVVIIPPSVLQSSAHVILPARRAIRDTLPE